MTSLTITWLLAIEQGD